MHLSAAHGGQKPIKREAVKVQVSRIWQAEVEPWDLNGDSPRLCGGGGEILDGIG